MFYIFLQIKPLQFNTIKEIQCLEKESCSHKREKKTFKSSRTLENSFFHENSKDCQIQIPFKCMKK
jgi:hypothetical protein